jgi:hypothetical protein
MIDRDLAPTIDRPRRHLPFLTVALLCGLAGCASSSSVHRAPSASAAQVLQYAPPGPSSDPWGPYVAEAAARFAVPERWIREVMRQESGGQQYLAGSLTTSSKGAMGLMQVMPGTYAELRTRHGLGKDPYHPRDNILAGAAYLREMHDLFGAPGFLAAYNAGPRRVEEYLAGRPLPAETVAYVAAIAPRLGAPSLPSGRLAAYATAVREISAAELNRQALAGVPAAVSTAAPPGVPVARPAPAISEVSADQLNRRVLQELRPAPTPPAPAGAPTVVANSRSELSGRDPRRTGPAPSAATVGATAWAVQVGAFSSPTQAHAAAEAARSQAAGLLNAAEVAVGTTTGIAGAILYRARLVGISSGATANAACNRLGQQGMVCVVLPPDAQT